MAFDGSGGFDLISPEYPAISGEVITDTAWNAMLEDFAAAFENCVTRDGQGAASGEQTFVAGLLTNTIGERTSGSGVTIDGLKIKDAGFALGSDTNGDMYYRNTGVLVRLAKGSSGQVLTMGAAYPAWAASPGFASGTVMVFYQAAAPTGWTQSTAHNDKALRVVSTAGGGSGGTDDLSTPPSTAHTHSGAEHNHQFYTYNAGTWDSVWAADGSTPLSLTQDIGTGRGWWVADTNSTVNKDLYTKDGGTGNTGSAGPTAFAPKYIDVIICTKD